MINIQFHRLSLIYKGFLFLVISVVTDSTSAQVKPNGQTVPSSTTQTLNLIPSAYASDITVNYIRTWDALKPFSDDSALSSGFRTAAEVRQTTQYFDGIGRPLQTVAKNVTPSGYDMVSSQLYDPFGRELFQYSPYVDSSGDGNFKFDPFHKQANFEKAFYNPTNDANGEKFFYSKTNYEPSALNRPTKIFPQGNSWVGRNVGDSMQYFLNTSADSVCMWDIDTAQGSVPVFAGYYPNNTLFENVVIDARGYSVVEYKDKQGRLILKKIQPAITGSYSGPTGWLNTYYVYDDLGFLRFGIQPKATEYLRTHSWAFDGSTWRTSTIAKELCFSYEYDARARTVIKRAPATNETWLVYDARDRAVMTQDSLQRSLGKWLYIDYDSLNRRTTTGIWANSSDRKYHQGLAYNSVTYPTPSSNYTMLTQTYYDEYNWVSSSGSGLGSNAYTGYNNNTNYFYTASDGNYPYPRLLTTSNLTRGKVTGTKVNVLATNVNLFSVNFFDDRGRLVQIQNTNYVGDIDTSILQYSYSNQILRTLICHGKGGTNPQAYQVLSKTTYDAAYHITQLTQKIGNSNEVLIAQNQYDELGQLAKKKIGQQRNSLTDYSYSSIPVDSLAYEYNIRGWLRGINKSYANAANNNSWFGMELNYDYGFSTTYLNGNIAGIKWRNTNDGAQRAYGFSYDGANRLTKADFTQNAGTSTWDNSAGIDFSVHKISYDQNGNITAMNQMGLKVNASSLIDSLVYSYVTNTNRLNYATDKVNDTSAHLEDFTEINNNTTQDYLYDGNGNLTKDNNKNITSVHYNFLNLPDSITMAGKGTIKYVYTATGIKLQKIVNDSVISKSTRTDYQGLFIYQDDTLQYVTTPEGRARPRNLNQSDTVYYDYFEKDHLGNTRVVLTDERQQDNYPAATLENNTNSFVLLQKFYDINIADTISTSTIASWPSTDSAGYHNNNGPFNNDPYVNKGATSTVVYKLNGANGDKTGLGIALKVMAGDKVDVYAKSFWHSNGTINNGYNISNALSAFITAFAGTGGVGSAAKGSTTAISSAITGSTGDVAILKNLLDTSKASTGSIPRAYVNWILFDEQFKPVSSGSGFDGLKGADSVKNHHKTVTIPQGGYLYVYCSNESNVDVFFDNLQLIHTRGPLLETDNYYPFGLIQAGISSKGAGKLENKLLYNSNEKQDKEFFNGGGLEWTDYGARMYDAQLGRWHVADPVASISPNESAYAFAGNSPTNFTDIGGFFKISSFFARRYPNLAKIVKYYLPLLKDNPYAKEAWIKSIGFSDHTEGEKRFDEMVTYGKGPWIDPSRPAKEQRMRGADKLDDFFEPIGTEAGNSLDFPDNLVFHHSNADDLEAAIKNGNVNTIGMDMFVISVLMMHEGTHWGKKRYNCCEVDGDDRKEMGANFEYNAFGVRFSYTLKHDYFSKDEAKAYYDSQKGAYGTPSFGFSINQFSSYWRFVNSTSTPSGQTGDATVIKNGDIEPYVPSNTYYIPGSGSSGGGSYIK